MVILGKTFSIGTLKRIQTIVDETPDISRRTLSKRVCELLSWRSQDGRLKDMSCRKALANLHKTGNIQLPEPLHDFSFNSRVVLEEFVRTSISCSLQELGIVTLVLIDNRRSKEAKTWKSLMSLHYLGDNVFYGGLRYLVHSSVHGWLGALAFGPAAFHVSSRDQFIGWNEQDRLANLDRIIGNSRFFIHPNVRVPNLASHVLGKVLRRVKQDWLSRFGKEPLLVETFVEQKRFTGASYRAANWEHIGTTAGRGRQGKINDATLSPKEMFVYPLDRKWRELLGGSIREEAPFLPKDWAEEEWGRASLGDTRLNERLLILGRDRYAKPRANLPETCGSRSKTKAAYRFFDHKESTFQNLLAPHSEATTKRITKEKIVLAIQDTTTVNYGSHPATTGLGPISHVPTGADGLILHSTLAVNTNGTPIGVLAAQCWARPPAELVVKKKTKTKPKKKTKRQTLPIEQKESYKWLTSYKAATVAAAACPDTTIVSVGDREADLYELFALADRTPNAPLLLVRAMHDRKLLEEQIGMAEHLKSCSVAGVQELKVPRKGNCKARIAQLSIRYSRVTLAPPTGKEKLGSLSIWLILAEEENPPEKIEPLRWLLLTTAPTDSFEEACEHISWYTIRWCIEVFHKILKSGCEVESRQLGTAKRLEACLAIDMVVAWRIHYLTKLCRETPDVPCTEYFEEAEWKALVAFEKKAQFLAMRPQH
jgi:hypothetical protein